MTEPNNSL